MCVIWQGPDSVQRLARVKITAQGSVRSLRLAADALADCLAASDIRINVAKWGLLISEPFASAFSYHPADLNAVPHDELEASVVRKLKNSITCFYSADRSILQIINRRFLWHLQYALRNWPIVGWQTVASYMLQLLQNCYHPLMPALMILNLEGNCCCLAVDDGEIQDFLQTQSLSYAGCSTELKSFVARITPEIKFVICDNVSCQAAAYCQLPVVIIDKGCFCDKFFRGGYNALG